MIRIDLGGYVVRCGLGYYGKFDGVFNCVWCEWEVYVLNEKFDGLIFVEFFYICWSFLM